MIEPVQLLAMYLHLSWASERRRQPQVTDRLLLLAAELASQLEMPAAAAVCRKRILAHNPQHLIRIWDTIEEAVEYEDFAALSRQLHRRYPPEKVERMVHDLGIEIGNERAAYYSDDEYALDLLGRIRRGQSEE